MHNLAMQSRFTLLWGSMINGYWAARYRFHYLTVRYVLGPDNAIGQEPVFPSGYLFGSVNSRNRDGPRGRSPLALLPLKIVEQCQFQAEGGGCGVIEWPRREVHKSC
jgi:hypothetical protein